MVTLSYKDTFDQASFWHISQKQSLHKSGIKKGQKTLNNYYSSKSDAVFVGSMDYCLKEYPKYTKNGIYYLYKIHRIEMHGKKGEWVGSSRDKNTKKTDQFKCYDNIEPINDRIQYYGRYKIKNGFAVPYNKGKKMTEKKEFKNKNAKPWQRKSYNSTEKGS